MIGVNEVKERFSEAGAAGRTFGGEALGVPAARAGAEPLRVGSSLDETKGTGQAVKGTEALA